MRQTAKARRRAWRVATARTWIAQRAALARVRLSEQNPTRCRGRPCRVSAVPRPDAREAFRHRQRVVARHAMAPLVSVPPSAAASLPCMWPGGLPPTSRNRFACPSRAARIQTSLPRCGGGPREATASGRPVGLRVALSDRSQPSLAHEPAASVGPLASPQSRPEVPLRRHLPLPRRSRRAQRPARPVLLRHLDRLPVVRACQTGARMSLRIVRRMRLVRLMRIVRAWLGDRS